MENFTLDQKLELSWLFLGIADTEAAQRLKLGNGGGIKFNSKLTMAEPIFESRAV